MFNQRLLMGLIILPLIILPLYISSCGGGGGTDTVKTINTDTLSKINGQITDVLAKSTDTNNSNFLYSYIKELLLFPETAFAQNSPLAGIIVKAFNNNTLVDQDQSNSQGRFTLNVPSGETMISFTVGHMESSTKLMIPEDTTLNIVLTLSPDDSTPVEIADIEEVKEPIVCDSGFVTISDSNNATVVIDGNGGTCINAQQDCFVNIDVTELEFVDCDICIKTSDNSEVNISADDVVCDAIDTGIVTKDDSIVSIDSSGDVDFIADEIGIDSDNGSEVLLSGAKCTIKGKDNCIKVQGKAEVNTDECEILDAAHETDDNQVEIEEQDQDNEQGPSEQDNGNQNNNNTGNNGTNNDNGNQNNTPNNEPDQNNGNNEEDVQGNNDEPPGGEQNNNNEPESNNENPPPENNEPEPPEPSGVTGQHLPEMLALINEARSQSRNCGTEFFEATGPVSWNSNVSSAALMHTEDMATNSFFDHIGSDGSNTGQRLDAAGYDWSAWGENIFLGPLTSQQAVDGWLDSPGHCRNIMNPIFTEMGAANAAGEFQGFDRFFWTLVMTRPR